jgi:hypothetical protein
LMWIRNVVVGAFPGVLHLLLSIPHSYAVAPPSFETIMGALNTYLIR